MEVGPGELARPSVSATFSTIGSVRLSVAAGNSLGETMRRSATIVSSTELPLRVMTKCCASVVLSSLTEYPAE